MPLNLNPQLAPRRVPLADFGELNRVAGQPVPSSPRPAPPAPSSNPQSPIPNPSRSAFTLVELLTVIVIIGILAGLIIAAVGPARVRARNAAITLEINQLSMALDAYKDKYGDYPPDFLFCTKHTSDTDLQNAARRALERHLRKAFPQYQAKSGKSLAQTFINDLGNAGVEERMLSPAMALTFWLGGLPDVAGTSSTKLIGFSADPANPFSPNGPRLPKLFDFDETRLKPIEGPKGGFVYQYLPDAGTESQPYVYFKPRMDSPYSSETAPAGSNQIEYGYHVSSEFHPFYFDVSAADVSLSGDGQNVCVPYLEDAWSVSGGTKTLLGMKSDNTDPPNLPTHIRKWAQPKKFQILCAGLDDEFGVKNASGNSSDPPDFRFLFSTNRIGGANLTEGDYDNLTSFFSGRLEDHKQ